MHVQWISLYKSTDGGWWWFVTILNLTNGAMPTHPHITSSTTTTTEQFIHPRYAVLLLLLLLIPTYSSSYFPAKQTPCRVCLLPDCARIGHLSIPFLNILITLFGCSWPFIHPLSTASELQHYSVIELLLFTFLLNVQR